MVAEAGEKLLIVDYSTTWCGPCKMMAPKFDDMSNRYTQAVCVRVCILCACSSRAHQATSVRCSMDPDRSQPLLTLPLLSYTPQHTKVFVKVVGDSTPEAGQLLKREGVRSVPAFHFWKNGKRVDSISGADPERLEEVIMQNV